MKKKINFHFSVDDVLKSLIEVTDQNIKLTNHWFFSYLYKIYQTYNVKIAVYLFYEEKINNKIRNLTEVRNLKKELKENWIFFGAHALNYQSPPHKLSVKIQKNHIDKIYKEIIRFTGNKYLAKKLRLHEYSECYELNKNLRKYNVSSLFTTDRNIGAYRLKEKNKKDLLTKGITKFKGQNFIRTDFRIENMVKKKSTENIKSIKKILDKKNYLSIYSHEYELNRKICRLNFLNLLNKITKIYSLKSNLP